MHISEAVRAELTGLRTDRRALHRIPEESTLERETQRYLLEKLAPLAPDVLAPCADTGVRAVFRGQGGGRCVAFRADMDALCITECNTHDYASQRPGRMHACGHDGHMANLLALARLLAAHRDRLAGDVVLLFQPAEETQGGAKRMIDAGALADPAVEAIYGMHMMPDLPVGRVGTCVGPLMAQTCELDITLHGRAAHGAMPHMGADAIAAATHLYTLMQTSLARRVDPFEQALVTVGTLRAGERRNVIADRAVLECTVRTFSDAVYAALRGYIQDDLAAVERAFGVRGELTESVYYPCVHNHEGETHRVMALLGDALTVVRPKMIAEDFSYFQHAVPGVFVFCGCMDASHDAPLHNERFDFDEGALLYGLELFQQLVPWRDTPLG